MKKSVEFRPAFVTVWLLLLDIVVIVCNITNNTLMTNYFLEIFIVCAIIAFIAGLVLSKNYYDDDGNKKEENYNVQFTVTGIILMFLLLILIYFDASRINES